MDSIEGKTAQIGKKYTYQVLEVTIPISSQGLLEFTKKTEDATNEIVGINISTQSSGFVPGFNFLLGVKTKNRNTYVEPIPVETFVTNNSVPVNQRFTDVNIPSKGNDVIFTVDVGTTPTPAAFTFYIALRLTVKED